MRRGELPEQCELAKKSQYRRKIAALAKPLDPQKMKTMEIAEAFRKYILDSKDVPKYLRGKLNSYNRFLETVDEKGPIPKEDLQGLGFDAIAWELFYYNNVFFHYQGDRSFTGPLQFIEPSCGIELFVTALDYSEKRCSFYLEGEETNSPDTTFPPKIVLDTIVTLEEAVFRINTFRYYEAEPICSLILLLKEIYDFKKTILKSRLNKLIPKGKLRKNDFIKVVRRFASSGGDIDSLLDSLFAMRSTGLVVHNSYARDEIEHTIKLCNLIARSSITRQIMVHNEFMRQKKLVGMSVWSLGESNQLTSLDNVSWLADMAYGNPYMVLSDLQRSTVVSDQDLTDSQSLFFSCTMPEILKEIGGTPTFQEKFDVQAKINRFFKVLSTPSKSFRAAAAKVLDHLYIELTGKTLFETFPDLEENFRKVQQTDFIRAEDFPEIVEQWKKKYMTE